MRGMITAGVALISLTTSQQTLRVSVDAVPVDVLVTDGNRPVGGLTPSDFELRDSGVLQQLESVSYEDVPLSVMLALDTSSSVDGQPLNDLRRAGEAVIGLLRPGDRGALLTFSERVDLASPWTTDRQRLTLAIDAARAAGSTALHDATYTALTLRDSQPGRLLILIFSDGDDTASWLSGQTVIDIARRSDAVVYAVGLRHRGVRKLGYLADFRSGVQSDMPRVVPPAFTKSFLAAVAEETGGRYIDAQRGDRLEETFVRIVTEFRSRYLLTYIPTGVDAGGWHRIDVKLKTKAGHVVARRGYLR